MGDLLAVDWSPVSQPLATAARSLAALLGARSVREVSLPPTDSLVQDAWTALDEAGDAVLVLRGGVDERTWHVLAGATRPALTVADTAEPIRSRVRRVQFPLDGTADAAAAVFPTLQETIAAGAHVLVQHVLDPTSVPPYWDHAPHAQRAWEAEFLARFCPGPTVEFRLAIGRADDEVLRMARDEQVDLIVLAWTPTHDPRRAPVVRRAVAAAPVPVLVVPIPGAQQ
jgi:Universal stress protein family